MSLAQFTRLERSGADDSPFPSYLGRTDRASAFADRQQRAFLWENDRMSDLWLAPRDDFFSAATEITDRGLIVVNGRFGCCGHLLQP